MSLNEAKSHEILNELYVQACGDLLSAYGLTVSVQAQGKSERVTTTYMSIMGATSERIRLLSTLKIDRDVVASLNSLAAADVSDADLEDWCRELNNQLVGRVKNMLLGYGHLVTAGLPVLLRGVDVRPVVEPNSEVHGYSIESAHGRITLTLGTLLASDLEFRKAEFREDEEPCMAEGAMALF